jgi:predicted nucleotidyltransferase
MNNKLPPFREYHQQRDQQRQRHLEERRGEFLRVVREAVRGLAAGEPAIEKVGLFGSLVQPGRFRRHSDVDVALLCDNLEAEGRFWRALEAALQRNVDIRPWSGSAVAAVEAYGEVVYEREIPAP